MRFTVTYDGPAVASGRMDAETLGGAMLSMSQLLDRSAAVSFGTTTGLQVDVVADFKEGSFSYDLVAVSMSAGQIARNLLATVDVGHLLQILGISGSGGLIGLLIWLRKRKVTAITPTADNRAEVHTQDGDSTIINAHTVNLFQNNSVRVALSGVVAPLRREGITELRTGRDKTETVVRAEDVDFFDAPVPEGEILQDKVSLEIVQLVTATFLPDRKWRFQLPDGTAFNSYLDEEFTKKVLGHVLVFGAGDALEVELRTVVYREPGNGQLKAQREIVRVVDHLPAVKQQLGLPGIGEPPSA